MGSLASGFHLGLADGRVWQEDRGQQERDRWIYLFPTALPARPQVISGCVLLEKVTAPVETLSYSAGLAGIQQPLPPSALQVEDCWWCSSLASPGMFHHPLSIFFNHDYFVSHPQ